MSNGFKLVTSEETVAPRPSFVTIYGQPGVGKTTLSFTMPKPVVHFDFDNGITRADQANRPDYYAVTDYGSFSDFVYSDEFQALIEDKGWTTCVLDTIGTLLDDYIAPYLIRENPKNGTGSQLSLAGWGALSTEFNRLRHRLQGELGLHICAICHEKEEGDGNSKQTRLAVKGGSSDIIYRSCDMLGYMYIKGTKRTIDFNPTMLHVGKNVARLPESTVPDAEANGHETWLEDNVVQRSLDQMQTASKAALDMQAKLTKWKERIAGLKKPIHFSGISEEVRELKGTSKALYLQVGDMVKKRLAKLGIEWNAELEQYTWTDPAHAQAAKEQEAASQDTPSQEAASQDTPSQEAEGGSQLFDELESAE